MVPSSVIDEDDQQHRHPGFWTIHPGMVSSKTKPSFPLLPTTFNQEPYYVRRLTRVGDDLLTTSSSRPPSPIIPTQTSDIDRDADDRWSHRSTSLSFKLKKTKHSQVTRRVCEKDGTANVTYKSVSQKMRRYVLDIYTTLVDSRWMTSLMLFATSFYFIWLVYAVVYYIICYAHGDLEEANIANPDWKPCILAIDGFAAAFLFSLETQHTIGYGTRQTTTECAEAMIVMSTQSVIGCLIQAFMVGLVFAKLSTPGKRAKTVVFSKNAVICERDHQLCLLFRLGDMRIDSFIVGTEISAKLIRRKVTIEGEMFQQVTPIKLKPDTTDDSCMFLIWPINVVHVIDADSPFYKLSAPELSTYKFELHIALEGTIEATSMRFQARTSYLPNEILWGHRFEPMMIYRKDHNKYQVNFSAFNSTYEVDTPLCSAYDLEQHYKKQRQHVQWSRNTHSSPYATTLPPKQQFAHNLAAGIAAEFRSHENGSDPVLPEVEELDSEEEYTEARKHSVTTGSIHSLDSGGLEMRRDDD